MNIPQAFKGKKLVHAWTYHATDGVPFGAVGRYEDTNGKDVVPFFKRNGSNLTAGIELNPRPLYGLNQIHKHPKDQPVFVVEGEKCAAALQSIGLCSVTSLGGSGAADKADWTPLNGFNTVILWPDNDEPGDKYARAVYHCLMALEKPPEIKLLQPEGLPKGGDCVDWLQSFTPEWDGLQPFPENLTEPIREELDDVLENSCQSIPDDWRKGGFVGSVGCITWGFPEKLNTELPPVPAFDIKMLPDSIINWVDDFSKQLSSPPDYMATATMVALSAVIGKKGYIRPSQYADWIVCPNLWGLNVGRPSAYKSPLAEEGKRPLERLEIKAKEVFEAELKEYEVQNTLLELGKEEAKKAARSLVKNKKFSEAEKMLRENSEEAEKPVRKRYIVNDCTIEKLGEILGENPNGIMLYRDEIYGFLKTIEREDRSNDRAFYLECFEGKKRYQFDRIGRGTLDIESTCLAMLGNIQPGVLRPYLNQATCGGIGNDGLISRFQLMVWPDSIPYKAVKKRACTEAKNKAFEVFMRLDEWAGWEEPARFTPTAQAIFDDWYTKLQERLRGDDIHPLMEQHLGKYASLLPSLAAIIHLADNPSHTHLIDAAALRKALLWIDYLEQHAIRIYNTAVSPDEINAETILKKIKEGRLSNGFKARDIVMQKWTGLAKTETVKQALKVLDEYGHIREEKIQAGKAGGRPSTTYHIHPDYLKE